MTQTLLTIRQVCDRLSLKPWAVYRNIRDNGFPPPIKLNPRVSRWDETAVNDWIEARRGAGR